MALTASGPAALYSSRPTLATPNQGRTEAASRDASTRSSRSRTIASRVRMSSWTSMVSAGSCPVRSPTSSWYSVSGVSSVLGMDRSDQVADGADPLSSAPGFQVVEDGDGGARVGEGGGADLDRAGPGDQQLGRRLAVHHAAHADHRDVGPRRPHVV